MKLWPIQQRERKAWKPRKCQSKKKIIPTVPLTKKEPDQWGRVCGKKGDPFCKIIAKGSSEKYEYTLHATKGYRIGRV